MVGSGYSFARSSVCGLWSSAVQWHFKVLVLVFVILDGRLHFFDGIGFALFSFVLEYFSVRYPCVSESLARV